MNDDKETMSFLTYNSPFYNLFDTSTNFTDIFPSTIDNYPYITNTLYTLYPRVDDDGYTYTMNVPGMTKDDVVVTISNGLVSVKAEKSNRDDEIKAKYIKKFTLPDDVDEDQIKATVENGIFKMLIPKKNQEEETGVRIVNVE